MDTEERKCDQSIEHSDDTSTPSKASCSSDTDDNGKKDSDFHEYSQVTKMTDFSPSKETISADNADDERTCEDHEYSTVAKLGRFVSAQVALDSDHPYQPEATKCLDMTVKIPEDKEKVFVMRALGVSDFVIIVDNNNGVLKLFNQTGGYLSSVKFKNDIWGLTCVSPNSFATFDLESNQVSVWKLQGQEMINEESFGFGHIASGIDYNGTYFCILHSDINAFTILERKGTQVGVNRMTAAFGRTFKFGCDIHMDSKTNNIHIPCLYEHGVLCMTLNGTALWFTPFYFRLQSITEIQGLLCVADSKNSCLHLISKEGKYVCKLLDQKDLIGTPHFLSYNRENDKLYVTYESWNDSDKISVYNVN